MILMVDDEPLRVSAWTDALKRRFGDSFFLFMDDVGAFVRYLRASGSAAPDLLILDVGLPTPDEPGYTERSTEYGTRTGAQIFDEVRARWPGTTVFFLTNVDDAGVKGRVIPKLGERGRYLDKYDTAPEKLVAAACDALGLPHGPDTAQEENP